MPFDTRQDSYLAIRSVIAEKTSKLVVWLGSGLSSNANLPTWPQLRARLVSELRAKASGISARDSSSLEVAARRAEREPNCWLAFEILRRKLGASTYRSVIREALRPALTASCPTVYQYVWKLRPAGLLNLNLDRLATMALGQVSPHRIATEFSGRDVGKFLHSLKSPHPFVANLHGIADDESTWVFTQSDLKGLLASAGYSTFVKSCLATTTTLFVGIRADDVAAGGHIEALTHAGVDAGPHYWLTSRDDIETDSWAEQAGIRVIRYRSEMDHSEITEFFQDILRYVPEDDGTSPPPVVLEHPTVQCTALPDAEHLAKQEAEDIRSILNTHAKRLLGAESAAAYSDYEAFIARYDEAIYRAWYTSSTYPRNKLLGFTLLEEVARGAFGRVYRASAPDGRQVAIKVLLEDVRRDPCLLRSFRRGVRSMRFLSERGVDGMVAYQEASEIPAFVVMDWIDGPTLSEAVEARQIEDWTSILRVALQMTEVIRSAHLIPERVLHRDVRPSNIMFDGFYSRPDEWKVVVLDFDLSWHLGALEASVVHNALAGYLAPEQIQATPGASTRHAAVDSFGVGMTLYFLVSGRDPLPSQHKHRDWRETVLKASAKREGENWLSLPYRYTRLVIRSTSDSQADRWDMSQIKDEVERLNAAFLDPTAVASAELLAEEMAARSRREYEWDDDRGTATIDLASGLVIRIAGDESGRVVAVNFNWSSTGEHDRKRVGKWMTGATERCVAALKRAGWRVKTKSVRRPQSIVLEATLSVSDAAKFLARHVDVLRDVTTILNFD